MVRNLLFVGLTVACGEEKDRESAARATAEMQDDATDTGSWSGGDAEDSEYQATPDAWTLSGELVVEGGLLSAERSTVTAEVVDAMGAVICHENAGVTSSARVVEPPDDDVEAWWSVLLEAGDADNCEAAGVAGPLPESLSLGLGPLHPEVVAVLDSDAGEAPPEPVDAKSIFASFDGGEVWVFGVATMKPEPGVATPDGDADRFGVADGLWRFRAVYPFRY